MEGRAEVMESILLYQRGIEPGDACPGCRGWGRKTYASTATWRGGMAGQAMTGDVCDECWGSGDRHAPWTDLRKLDRALRAFKRASDESDYCYACDCHPSSGHAKGCVMVA